MAITMMFVRNVTRCVCDILWCIMCSHSNAQCLWTIRCCEVNAGLGCLVYLWWGAVRWFNYLDTLHEYSFVGLTLTLKTGGGRYGWGCLGAGGSDRTLVANASNHGFDSWALPRWFSSSKFYGEDGVIYTICDALVQLSCWMWKCLSARSCLYSRGSGRFTLLTNIDLILRIPNLTYMYVSMNTLLKQHLRTRLTPSGLKIGWGCPSSCYITRQM